jgi:hypothetical protein
MSNSVIPPSTAKIAFACSRATGADVYTDFRVLFAEVSVACVRLGPMAENGAAGTPETVAATPESITGRLLKRLVGEEIPSIKE